MTPRGPTRGASRLLNLPFLFKGGTHRDMGAVPYHPWRTASPEPIRIRPWPVALRAMAAAIALAAMAGPGCPRKETAPLVTLPVVTTDDPAAEADLRAARAAADEGRSEEAARLFERFLDVHRGDPLVPVAKLELGRLRLADGRMPAAQELFADVVAHEDPALAERARFYQGVALHLGGQHERALAMLEPFVNRTVNPEDTALLLRTMAAASLHLSDRVGAVEAYDRLLRSPTPEPAQHEARQGIATIVQDQATPDEVYALLERLPPGGLAWRLTAERAARELYATGEVAKAQGVLEALRDADVELDDELQRIAVRVERSGQAELDTIGAILPLSGRGREVGQDALRGLMLAAGIPPTSPVTGTAPKIVFRDDGGDPERAARAVDDLVSLHRVVAIVGPVDREAAERAAARAQQVGVPLITLSAAPGLAERGPMVFRQFFTPRQEVRELVDAARARGARRFAVVHPESPYGTAMAEALRTVATEVGLELVSTVPYAAGATSFREAIEALKQTRFDALLLADGASQVSLLAPALAAAGISGSDKHVTLLAPTVALSPTTIRSAQRYLQGALFAQPFDPAATDGPQRTFRERFEERYGHHPGAFAAYAYDSVGMVRQAVDEGATSRAEVAARLRTMSRPESVGPSRGFQVTGEPARGPRVFELKGASLVPAPPGNVVDSGRPAS